MNISEPLHVIIKPGYDKCCDCIDKQIQFSKTMDCREECETMKEATLHSFVMDKGKIYGIVSSNAGYFYAVELWQIMLDPKWYLLEQE